VDIIAKFADKNTVEMNRLIHLCVVLAAFFFSQAAWSQCYQYINFPVGVDTICDNGTNEMDFWNESYWYDSLNLTQNLAETPAELRLALRDVCHYNPIITYLMHLDLDGNDTLETALHSDSLPPANTVMFGNIPTGYYAGGQPRSFDERSISEMFKFRFALQQTANSDTLVARVRWSPGAAPNIFTNPIMPHTKGKIWWFLRDGLHVDTVSYEFLVRDCAAPSVSCKTGQTFQVKANGQATVFLGNVYLESEDLITPTPLLQQSIRKAATGTGFPTDADGNPVVSLSYACTEIGQQVVEVWARDKAGNTQKCVTAVQILDDSSHCAAPPSIKVCAELTTGYGMDDIIYLLQVTPPPPQPSYVLFEIADTTNCEEFPGNFNGLNLTLTPSRESDWLNGVSTLDLVLISKHILAVEPLNSPYKMIAADANANGSITTFDIVLLRKLILGVTPDVPGSKSWHFIPSDFVFQNPQNPLPEAFPEYIALNPYLGVVDSFSFLVLKTGDVNWSALPNAQQRVPDERSTAYLDLKNTILARGEAAEIPIFLRDVSDIQGFQLGLDYDEDLLQIEGVRSDLRGFSVDNSAVAANRLQVSWSDAAPAALSASDPLFWFQVRARKEIRLSDALRGLGGLHPEVYRADLSTENLQLRFIDSQGRAETVIAAPQPNPGTGPVHFLLQIADLSTDVRVQVFDLQGKTLYDETIDALTGAQRIALPASVFPAAGAYPWRVTAGQTQRSGILLRHP
jgi:hypothetical protein